MPKMKTHSGAKKRFSITKKGKLKRSKAFARHLLSSKNSKRKSGLCGTVCSYNEAERVKKMLPYA